jgi:outer membrane protein assembly factor BamB
MNNIIIKSTFTILVVLLLFLLELHSIQATSDIQYVNHSSMIKNNLRFHSKNGKQTESIHGVMNSSWPIYCHDIHHTGQSSYSTITNMGEIKWKFQGKGGMDSSPTLDKDGTVYIGTNWGYLFAINQNGTEKWRYTFDDWVTSSPAIADDGTIYVGSWDCYFYAINSIGTLKWRFYTQDTVRSSPVIAEDGTIYFGVLGPGVAIGRIYALYPNGTEKWHIDTGNWVYSSGALDEQGTIYFTSNDGNLYAIYPNGTIKWTFGLGYSGSPAIGDDGTIYVASHGGYLYALYQNGTERWKTPIGWGSGHVPSIANDGTIYIGGDELYAIYPNGTQKWAFNPGRFYDATSSSQAISAEGTIYFGVSNNTGTGGYLIAVNPDGTEKWRKWIHDAWVYSSPSIGADGTVYIGSTWASAYGILYAFNGNKFEAPVITQPKQGKLYLFNQETISTLLGKIIAIGKLTIQVSHPDQMNVSKIEFYLDNIIQFEDTTPPYEWIWKKITFGRHDLEITATSLTGITKTVGIEVWKFF